MNADNGTSVKPLVHGKDGTYTRWKCRCEACRAAHCEKVTQYRSTPKGKRNARAYSDAATRALWRLARGHPDEYRRFYEEELARDRR